MAAACNAVVDWLLVGVVGGCEQKRCVAATSGHNDAAATGHNENAPFTARPL